MHTMFDNPKPPELAWGKKPDIGFGREGSHGIARSTARRFSIS
ncbi:hypothetical protein BH23ACT11_BH23ACT11_29900 [soil metagenome]